MATKIRKLSDHYIVCGFGRIGEIIARSLGEEPAPIEPEVIETYSRRQKAQRASPEFGMADWRAAVRQVEGYIKQTDGADWRQ